MSVSFHPWKRSGAELDATLLRLAVGYAIQAPSSHNTQPWLFHVAGSSLELWADRERALPVVDKAGRELIISCGAALFALRIALRRFGYEPIVEVLAEPGKPDLLARVSLGPRMVPSDEDVTLCEAIGRRRTNRAPFEEREVPRDVLAALRGAVEIEGTWIELVEERRDRHALAELVAAGDHRQWHDPAFRHELAQWIRNNRHGVVDGMPGHAFGVSDFASLFGPMVVRTFDRGDGQAARDLELADGAPVLALLGTAHDRPRDWLLAGEVLMRMLLTATDHGLAASFLNQPIEIPELREKIAELAGNGGAPQLLVRLGYPTTESRITPRRALEDVLF